MRELDKYRARPHWSFSSLNLFLTMCTLQWAFRYIYRQESEHTPVNLVFGSAFHRACEMMAEHRRVNKSVSPKVLAECFAGNFADGCREETVLIDSVDQAELTDKGRSMIQCLYDKWPLDEKVVTHSRAFCVPILDAHGDLVTEKPLIGEIDCIVGSHSDSGAPETLIDWKTTARKWPETKAADDLQATAFLYGYNMSGGATSVFRYDVISKTKVPGYQQCPTTRSMEDMHRFSELVRTVEKAVEAEAFWPNHTCFGCGGCQFRSACKAWHRDRAKTISQPSLKIVA